MNANINGNTNANVGEEEKEVVPPHLDPVQQGAIIAELMHNLAELQGELARRNQHL